MGEGNAWSLVPNDFGGYPWEPETKKILDSESPYTYVKDINTPLLIIHGDQDLRTGTIQGEMLYKSLKILGKPVEYFPDLHVAVYPINTVIRRRLTLFLCPSGW